MNTRGIGLERILSSLVLFGCFVGSPVDSIHAQGAVSGAGSLDAGFFAAMVVGPNWSGTPTVRRMGVQSDGRLLIAGGFETVQDFPRRGLARLHASGSLDRGFIPAVEFVSDLALEPDGKIVVAATYSGLVRLNPDGTLDSSFAGDVPDGATAVARLPVGEYLAGIHIDNEPADSSPRYSVALFDAQGRPSQRWSTQYRSLKPITFLLLAPGAQRLVVDGVAELALDVSGNNFKSLTHSLPAEFRPWCGGFQPDGKLLLGSCSSSGTEYTTNATLASALVRLNVDGSLDVSFATNLSVGVAEMEGSRDEIRIDALAVQPDGKILIGGFFTRVNGTPRPLVARLLPDGELDAEFVPDIQVNPGVDIDALQTVSAMALASDGKLLIGGVFSRINGLACHALARLHTTGETSGGILKFAQEAYYAWETNGVWEVTVLRSGPTNLQVSVIYEALDLPFDIPVPGLQRGTLVFAPGETRATIALPLRDNQLLDGNHSFHLALSNPGGGAVLTGTPETQIAIFDDEQAGRPGSVDMSYPPLRLEGVVYNTTLLAIEADGSALLSVQTATNYWTYQPVVMRLDPTGQIDPTFQAVVTDQAVSCAFPDPVSGKTLIAGGFSVVNGQNRGQLARLNHDGSLDAAFQVVSDNWIGGATVEPDGKIMIYGHFNSVNGVPRTQLARLESDGSVDPEFDTSALGWIGTLTCVASQADGKTVIGGSFHQVNGMSRTNLARLNRNGSLDVSFVPVAFPSDPTVHTLLGQPDGKLLVGGYFGFPDGRWTSVIRLQANGSLDTTFGAALPAFDYGQSLLLQSDGKILVDGKWRLNPDGSRDYSFFTGDDGASVSAAAFLPNGDLLVSGGFTTFAEWPRPHLVRLHGGDAPVFGFFEVAETSMYVREDAGPALVLIRRVGPTNEAATVDYATADSTARAGVDYTAVSGTFHFAPGVLEQTVSIAIINNDAYQRERFFHLDLWDRTAGIRWPSASGAGIHIIEDDPGLTFSQTTYWVSSDAISTNGNGAWVANVQRPGDLTDLLTVQCQLLAGTAVAGQDFVATNMTLRLEPAQYEIQVIAPVLRNEQAVEDRTLFLVLNHPNPNVSLATDATAMLTILGQPRPPAFIPGSATLDRSGHLRVQCDVWSRSYVQIQASTNLVDWIYVGYVYREPNAGPVYFEDPDAWKYPGRFYRILQYDGSGD
jgi:uncharacterized delta-60 repeat protein